MEWSDEGIVLAARALGETSVVLSLLTRAHGRHSGLVRGGAGRRTRGLLQPGNRLAARWRARLADHLGTMSCEPGRVLAPGGAGRPGADWRRVAAACAVAETALPEREPLPAIYRVAGRADRGDRDRRRLARRLCPLGVGPADGARLRAGSRPLRGDRDDRRSRLRLAALRPRRLGRGGRALEATGCCALPAFLVDASAPANGEAMAERSGADRAFPAAPRLRRAGPGAAGGARAAGGGDRARRPQRGESEGGRAHGRRMPAAGRSRTFRSARRSPSAI